MYTIDFDPKLEKTLQKWKKSNPILFKKLTKILHIFQASDTLSETFPTKIYNPD